MAKRAAPKRARLDAELVRRRLARSRGHAAELIEAGRVTIRGTVATKAATGVENDAAIVVAEDSQDENWASRGARKLLGALDQFPISVDGRRCLDAGASTGGFTDVLLRAGAREVVAADVGRGLLVWRLQTDERVHSLERTNVRHLTPELIGGQVDLIVADLSFISLGLVLPALASCLRDGGDLVPMVKPQFEVGKQRVGAGGVVRDPEHRRAAVRKVVDEAAEAGLVARGVTASPLPGPSGNVEYFVWLRRDETGDGADDIDAMVADAVRDGPQ